MTLDDCIIKYTRIKFKNKPGVVCGLLIFNKIPNDPCKTRTLTSKYAFIIDGQHETSVLDFANIEIIHYRPCI